MASHVLPRPLRLQTHLPCSSCHLFTPNKDTTLDVLFLQNIDEGPHSLDANILLLGIVDEDLLVFLIAQIGEKVELLTVDVPIRGKFRPKVVERHVNLMIRDQEALSKRSQCSSQAEGNQAVSESKLVSLCATTRRNKPSVCHAHPVSDQLVHCSIRSP